MVTAKRSAPRKIYPLSDIGKQLGKIQEKIPNQFIAYMDGEIFIENNKELWYRLCNEGYFDQWDSIAPFNSLLNKENARILFLKLYRIKNEIGSGQIDTSYPYYDRIIGECRVTVEEPIIPEGQFKKLKQDIISIVKETAKLQETK